MKNNRFIKYAAVFLFSVVAAVLFSICFSAESVSSGVIRETLDLTRPQKNISGEGYYWNNRENILELNGINVNTDDEYGIKLIDGATVKLFGQNYISASEYALAGQGGFIITGDGSLTIVTDGDGIYSYSTAMNKEIKIRSGDISITAGRSGIRFDSGVISIVGGNTDIAVSNSSNGTGITGGTVQITGGSVFSNASVSATGTLRIIASDVRAETEPGRAVLYYGKSLLLEKVDLQTGESSDSLSNAEAYDGESSIATVSNAYRGGTSAILGDGFPKYADIILIVLAIILLVVIAGLPVFLHFRKTKLMIKKLESENLYKS